MNCTPPTAWPGFSAAQPLNSRPMPLRGWVAMPGPLPGAASGWSVIHTSSHQLWPPAEEAAKEEVKVSQKAGELSPQAAAAWDCVAEAGGSSPSSRARPRHPADAERAMMLSRFRNAGNAGEADEKAMLATREPRYV